MSYCSVYCQHSDIAESSPQTIEIRYELEGILVGFFIGLPSNVKEAIDSSLTISSVVDETCTTPTLIAYTRWLRSSIGRVEYVASSFRKSLISVSILLKFPSAQSWRHSQSL